MSTSSSVQAQADGLKHQMAAIAQKLRIMTAASAAATKAHSTRPSTQASLSSDCSSELCRASNGAQSKHLNLIHFNDVYNIESRMQEPVGGAARFVTMCRQLQQVRHHRQWHAAAPPMLKLLQLPLLVTHDTSPCCIFIGHHRRAWLQEHNALVLFGGDCFNPSIMSNITKGEQMPPVLNACGVQAAVVGNHDLDFGRARMAELIRKCSFPWLMANIRDKETGAVFDGCARCVLPCVHCTPLLRMSRVHLNNCLLTWTLCWG
jgi:5'-nucleotidase